MSWWFQSSLWSPSLEQERAHTLPPIAVCSFLPSSLLFASLSLLTPANNPSPSLGRPPVLASAVLLQTTADRRATDAGLISSDFKRGCVIRGGTSSDTEGEQAGPSQPRSK